MTTMTRKYQRDYMRRRRLSPAQRKKEVVAARAYREKNPDKAAISSANRRKMFLGLLIQAKGGPCKDCGGVFHHSAMDFDHVRGKKSFQVSDACAHTIAALYEEIAKCDLVCSNCHRVRTYTRHREKANERQEA